MATPVSTRVAHSEPVRLPARYYAMLLELIGNGGVSMPQPLSATGLDAASLQRPGATLALEQMETLIAAAVETTGREDLGFHLGRLIKPSSHEFLGYALMTSATLDEALRLAARYWRLITPTFTLRHQRDDHGVRIDLEPALPMCPLTLRFHLETLATAFHEEIGFLLAGKIPAYELYLPESLAGVADRYRQLLPARIHFTAHGHAGIRIMLSDEAITRPLALADRHALELARLRCDEALSRLTGEGSMTAWISLMLEEADDHQPRQHELARMLNLSTRTMNRRLAAEGQSFRELGIQARQQRACRLLAGTRMAITRIAYQLGYRDAANFSRAFRRHHGMSPLDYRKRMTGPARPGHRD